MIRYTLLPESEIKSLKREYRTRLAIFLSFFVSLAVLIGICALAPAYLYSISQEKEALGKAQVLQKKLKESGTETIFTDLREAQVMVGRIKSNPTSKPFGDILSSIIKDKNANIKLISFSFTEILDASSTPIFSLIMSGKSATRDAIVNFKRNLDKNEYVEMVDLPVSDLAKSKDIDFSMKLTLKQK